MAGGERDPPALAEGALKQGVFSGWAGRQDRYRAEPQTGEERRTPLREDGSRAGGPWRAGRVAATKTGEGSPHLQGSPETSAAQPLCSSGGGSLVDPEISQEVIGQPWTSYPGMRVQVGGR